MMKLLRMKLLLHGAPKSNKLETEQDKNIKLEFPEAP